MLIPPIVSLVTNSTFAEKLMTTKVEYILYNYHKAGLNITKETH
jgi:hypothetical protein